ncbi:hypothetical protein AYI70_g7953 [Smittium culicis]|uniref:Uncharacterized protein n=1 Tax=Smittium culicis TaxID=133412 RepID=A0A1R1XI84_9FUNG|nr:hypothetical protein AYI70_g7953 [Smittium culicis]
MKPRIEELGIDKFGHSSRSGAWIGGFDFFHPIFDSSDAKFSIMMVWAADPSFSCSDEDEAPVLAAPISLMAFGYPRDTDKQKDLAGSQ